MRELSGLIDMQVIATAEGKRLGAISQALVDLAAGELVAVLLAGRLWRVVAAEIQEDERLDPREHQMENLQAQLRCG